MIQDYIFKIGNTVVIKDSPGIEDETNGELLKAIRKYDGELEAISEYTNDLADERALLILVLWERFGDNAPTASVRDLLGINADKVSKSLKRAREIRKRRRQV